MGNNRLIFDSFVIFDNRTPAPPYVIPSVSSISGLNYLFGSGPSTASASFYIAARGLVPTSGNITVTPPTDFEVFDGSTWKSTAFTIAYTGGGINTASIYKVRLKAGLTANTYSEVVTFAAAQAPTYSMRVSGQVIPIPTVNVSAPSLPAFPLTVIGDFSDAQSYTVDGNTLIDNIVITAPAGFIVNLDGSTTDASPIMLAPSAGIVAPTTIYVRFNPLLVQSYSGNITNSSTGATTKNVAVSGTGTVIRTQKVYNYYHYI